MIEKPIKRAVPWKRTDMITLFSLDMVAAMKELGVKWSDVARGCGLTIRTIKKIEYGSYVPDWDTFIKLCDEVGLEPEDYADTPHFVETKEAKE